MYCLNCRKELSEKQKRRGFVFCSKGCATSFRQKSNDPDCSKMENKNILWYLCGLIASDGNISNDKITISMCDKELIEKVYLVFCDITKRKIYSYKPKGENDSEIFSLINSNKDFISFLNEIGITEKKSKTIANIKVPQEYTSHFIRGVFDGDGSVYISSKHKNFVYLGVSITSASKIFLEQIQNILKENKIDSNIIKDSRKEVFYLKIYKKDAIKKFAKYIYQSATLYLERKHKIFYNEIV